MTLKLIIMVPVVHEVVTNIVFVIVICTRRMYYYTTIVYPRRSRGGVTRAPTPPPLPRLAALLVATDIASGLIARPAVLPRATTSPLPFSIDAVPAAVSRGGMPDLRAPA